MVHIHMPQRSDMATQLFQRVHVVVWYPEGLCRYMVTTWALTGLLYHDFGAYVYTIVVLGPLGVYT